MIMEGPNQSLIARKRWISILLILIAAPSQVIEATSIERRVYRIAERRAQEDSVLRSPVSTLTFSGDVDKIVQLANELGRDRPQAAGPGNGPETPLLPVQPGSSGGRDGQSLSRPPAPTSPLLVAPTQLDVEAVILDILPSATMAPTPIAMLAQPMNAPPSSAKPQAPSPSHQIVYMPTTVTVVDPIPTKNPSTTVTVSTDATGSSATPAPRPLTSLTNASYWMFPTAAGPQVGSRPEGTSESQPVSVPNQTIAPTTSANPTQTAQPTSVDCTDGPVFAHTPASSTATPVHSISESVPASPSMPGQATVANRPDAHNPAEVHPNAPGTSTPTGAVPKPVSAAQVPTISSPQQNASPSKEATTQSPTGSSAVAPVASTKPTAAPETTTASPGSTGTESSTPSSSQKTATPTVTLYVAADGPQPTSTVPSPPNIDTPVTVSAIGNTGAPSQTSLVSLATPTSLLVNDSFGGTTEGPSVDVIALAPATPSLGAAVGLRPPQTEPAPPSPEAGISSPTAAGLVSTTPTTTPSPASPNASNSASPTALVSLETAITVSSPSSPGGSRPLVPTDSSSTSPTGASPSSTVTHFGLTPGFPSEANQSKPPVPVTSTGSTPGPPLESNSSPSLNPIGQVSNIEFVASPPSSPTPSKVSSHDPQPGGSTVSPVQTSPPSPAGSTPAPPTGSPPASPTPEAPTGQHAVSPTGRTPTSPAGTAPASPSGLLTLSPTLSASSLSLPAGANPAAPSGYTLAAPSTSTLASPSDPTGPTPASPIFPTASILTPTSLSELNQISPSPISPTGSSPVVTNPSPTPTSPEGPSPKGTIGIDSVPPTLLNSAAPAVSSQTLAARPSLMSPTASLAAFSSSKPTGSAITETTPVIAPSSTVPTESAPTTQTESGPAKPSLSIPAAPTEAIQNGPTVVGSLTPTGLSPTEASPTAPTGSSPAPPTVSKPTTTTIQIPESTPASQPSFSLPTSMYESMSGWSGGTSKAPTSLPAEPTPVVPSPVVVQPSAGLLTTSESAPSAPSPVHSPVGSDPSKVPSVPSSMYFANPTRTPQLTTRAPGSGPGQESDVASSVASLLPSLEATTQAPSLMIAGNVSSPAASEDSIVSCGDASLERAETVVFTYALETSTNGIPAVEFVRKATEKALARDIANLLLPCDVEVVQADNALGFEAVDFVPEDTFSNEGDCEAIVDIRHACSVFEGILTVYISPDADFELARYYTLTAIRETISLLNAQIDDLERAAYLGPEIVNPVAFGDSEQPPQNIAPGPNNINASLVLFAVGGCAFAASIGLVYYLRRHGASSSSFGGAATHYAGSTEYLRPAPADGDRPLSPFSEMLPSAYRFDQDGNMSAILELDDESATQRSGVVSESGYTTDEDGSTAISMDGTASLRLNSPMLGARKRYDASMDSLLELM